MIMKLLLNRSSENYDQQNNEMDNYLNQKLKIVQNLTNLHINNYTNNSYITGSDNIRITGLIILVILFVTIIGGNLTVLIAIFLGKIRTKMRIFIANLAITDCFVAFFGILPEIVWNITIGFYAPSSICKLVKYMSSTITYASSFALIALSIDRAEAVCRPLRATSAKFSSKTHALILIGSGWFAASICGAPTSFLAQKVNEGTQYENCRFDFSLISPQVYLTSIAISVFIIPAFIIAICHIITVITIWRASKKTTFQLNKLNNMNENLKFKKLHNDFLNSSNDFTNRSRSIWFNQQSPLTNRNMNMNCMRNESVDLYKKNSQFKYVHSSCIPRAKVKTVKMTCLIVSAYVICWCPFMVWNLLVTYGCIKKHVPHLMKYSPIIQHLVPLNSSANPVIFWIFNAQNILQKRKKMRKQSVYHSAVNTNVITLSSPKHSPI